MFLKEQRANLGKQFFYFNKKKSTLNDEQTNKYLSNLLLLKDAINEEE